MATEKNQIGRYRIQEKIGSGGMGTVYRAWDSEIEREVALKWLPAYFSEDMAFVERFRREARTIARLEHPHIVPIYDVGEDDGRPYIIMRLLTGGTLRERIGREDFDLYALLKALEEIGSALEAAHARNIVHRDIKPGNILFDEHGSAFLSDFGIAKVLDAATQLTGSGLIGTPAYMSPEQFVGHQVDGRSDEYALAIVVYEALTGRLPFEGNTAQMMYKHLNAEVPEIDLQRYPVPAGLNPILARALSKDPNGRYPSVTEFVRAMRKVVEEDSSAAAIAALPLAAIPRHSTAQPSAPLTAPTEVDTPSPGSDQQLRTDYREGLEAMARNDWPVALAAFTRVLSMDPNYGNASEFHATARANLTPSATPVPPLDKTSIELPSAATEPTEVDSGAAAAALGAAVLGATAVSKTAVSPAAGAGAATTQTPPAQVPAAAPAKGGVPGWAKIAGGIALLLLLLLLGFFVIRNLGGGDEQSVAAGGNDGDNTVIVTPTTLSEETAPAATQAAEPTAVGAADGPATNTPAPTATDEPPPTEAADEPTAEPTAEAAVENADTTARVRVTVASANLRRGPGVVYPTAGAVFQGDEMSLVATSRDQTWYLVELADGQRAWVAASVSELVEGANLETVPVAATIPPAPTATRVPPTLTPIPIVLPTSTPPSPGGGGGNNGGGEPPPPPPPVYTAEPP